MPKTCCRASFTRAAAVMAMCSKLLWPGAKSVQRDLAWLRENGWDRAIVRHLRYGGKVLGICGGMQMLGLTVDDPDGIEGPPGRVDGLGLLPLATTLTQEKMLENVLGRLAIGEREAPV